MDKLEIYVHIPFCAKKCDYCDFLSMRGDSVTKREYVSALINEIKLSKDRMGRVPCRYNIYRWRYSFHIRRKIY